MIKDVEIRKATVDDVNLFYPEGSPYTIIAWLATYRGIPACLAGVIIRGGQIIPFTDIKENDAPQMTIWRTARALFERIKSLGLPLTTATECRRSPFLEALGFQHLAPNNGWEMYKWRP